MKHILTALILMVSLAGYSQTEIEGTIINATTKQPLIGASIYLPDLKKGTTTDIDGHFVLHKIPHGHFIVEISYLGYKTVIEEISCETSSFQLNTELSPSSFITEEVVIIGGQPTAQHENAIQIINFKAADLHAKGDVSFMRTLSKVPGVDIITKGNAVATPVIRGLSTSNILMLNNGLRVESYQFSANHPFLIDEFGVEKVEVIKGPASLLYGSDAVGGAINVISERPAKQNTTVVDGGVNYFTNGAGINTNLGIRSTGKNLFWGLRGGINSNQDYTDGNQNIVPNSRFNQKSVKFFSGMHSKHGATKVFYNFDKFDLGLVIPPAIALTRGKNSRKNEVWYQDLDNHMFTLKNTHFVRNSKFNFDISYQRNHRLLWTSDLLDEKKQVDMTLQTITGEMKDFISFSDKHKAIFSLQTMYQTNQNGDADQHVQPDFSMRSLAGVSIYKYSNNRLNGQAGLRVDYKNIQVPRQAKPTHDHSGSSNPTVYIEELNKDYFNVSASLGATYSISEHLLLRGNLASAFRTPNIAELTQDGIHGNRYERGNRSLVPQRNYELDLSMHYHTEQFVFDLSAFYNHIQNYIYLSPTLDTVASGQKLFTYQQSNAVLKGFETGVQYQPLKWFDLHSTYSFILGTQDGGINLPFIPQNKLEMGLKLTHHKTKSLPQGYFSLTGIYASPQDNPSQFETTTSDYFLLNTSLSTSFDHPYGKIDLQFGVSNILDTKYDDHLSTIKNLPYFNIGRNIFGKVRFYF